jgi:hypothetical protein
MTENNGVPELFLDPYWVDELWHEEARLAQETYRMTRSLDYSGTGAFKNFFYWRKIGQM